MKLTFRPEIDGLRTVAVMLVILHHLGWDTLSGGYVGVDVFFVISGYLITSIVYAEIKEGEFSLVNFYKRRIIRLAPAYFLVLAITSLVAIIYMLPAEILNYAQSVLYSTFFAANFYMWKDVGGYFGHQSDYIPLLHLWSLAVEEQFYIFWPLVLSIVYKLFGRNAVISVVLISVLAGSSISEWGVHHYPAASYYLLPTRFFELMIGALVASVPSCTNKKVGREFLGLLGLGLIIYSAITFTTARFFPGYSAFVPCIGGALIIYFTQSGQGFLGRLLATRAIVYTGRISYPAYLWHWPIIAFLNLNRIAIDWQVGLVVLIVTLVLSNLTYRYAEQPFRTWISRHRLRYVVGFGFALPALSVVLFSLSTISMDGMPTRFSDEVNRKSAAILSYTNTARGRCNEGNVIHPLAADKCILGIKDRPVDFLVIGDSHANHFTGMLDFMAKAAGIRGYDITQSQTIYLPHVRRFYLQDGRRIEHENFKIRNDALTEIIAQTRFKAVILAGVFTNYYSGDGLQLNGVSSSSEVFEQGLRAAIKNIMASGALVYIIRDTPILSGVSYDCGLNNLRFGMSSRCDFEVTEHLQNFRKWNKLLDQLQVENPDLLVISPDMVICDSMVCHTEINGVPLYRDDHHLNQVGSELLGRLYIERFGNPLAVLNGISVRDK